MPRATQHRSPPTEPGPIVSATRTAAASLPPPMAIRSGSEQEVAGGQADVPRQQDREVGLGIAVDVAADDSVGDGEGEVQFAGMVAKGPCADEAELLVAHRAGYSIDQMKIDVILLQLREIIDHIAAGGG